MTHFTPSRDWLADVRDRSLPELLKTRALMRAETFARHPEWLRQAA